MPEQWKCTVCGYLHAGPRPPEVCPVCGAEAARFIPLERQPLNLLRDLYDTFRLHPVAAHFPNALVPVAAVLLGAALAGGDGCLEGAVFQLLAFVLGVVPVSIASGIYDWRTRFGGERAPIFFKKLALALLLLLLLAGALALQRLHPGLLRHPGPGRRLLAGLVLAALPVVVLLGHYGGKLAWQWKKQRET
jgi:rubredoxin